MDGYVCTDSTHQQNLCQKLSLRSVDTAAWLGDEVCYNIICVLDKLSVVSSLEYELSINSGKPWPAMAKSTGKC